MSYTYKPQESTILGQPGCTVDQALNAMASGKVSQDAFKLFIAKREAAAKSGGAGKLTCKVAEKGGLSVYGLGRWPTTLYREQWERLIGFVPEIQKFIAEHDGELTSKGDEKPPAKIAA
jgi:hypothetical protein